MSVKYDYRLALITGIDFPIADCHLVIHQPNFEEIALIGEAKYNAALQTLCLRKEMFASSNFVVSQYSNFQIFMTIMKEKETADKKVAVQELLMLYFPNYQVSFIGNQSMAFMKGEDMITIDENNFESLQDAIRQVACLNAKDEETIEYNPVNEKARQIAERLKKNRQKAAQLSEDSISSVLTQYISSLAVGLRLSPKEIAKLTVFQLYDQIQRFSLYQSWDIDIKARLAGAEGDSEIENWMKNIY